MTPSSKKLVTSRSVRPSPSWSPAATPMPAVAVPGLVEGHSPRQPDLLEPKPSQVVEQQVRSLIVGHEDVEPAVVIEIGNREAQAVALVDDARLPADVRERAVAIVAIE